ncbi:MAG: DUF3800 domain-containing protein [Terriglobia bacterium]
MSHLLFVDQSGHDLHESPYEVLAGVSVEDRDLWNLITALHSAEEQQFAGRLTQGAKEIKGKKLLKRKVFRLAAQLEAIPQPERAQLARVCLDSGAVATRRQLVALAQAKLSFVREAFQIASRFRCKCFASIIDHDAPRTQGNYLRKDYAYLFERFFYFLEDAGVDTLGVVVFDELEKSRSHILLDQMYRYFRETAKGRQRSGRIIPEPFFVHSDLTTGIQLADLLAYVVSWGVRVHTMNRPARDELAEFARLALSLRHRSVREVGDNPEFVIWSFATIDDLRPRGQQEELP